MSTGHSPGGGQTTMPAYDTFHEAVKRGLIEEGWTITDDPYTITFGGKDLYVDLAAEKMIAAERGTEYIAAEIRSFNGPSVITDYHAALGQFVNYRMALDFKDPQRVLFLAKPRDTYDEFFTLPFTMESVRRHRVHMIVYDPEQEVFMQWVNQPATAP
jgi:hypothetical protein